jgi:hypothetical protein
VQVPSGAPCAAGMTVSVPEASPCALYPVTAWVYADPPVGHGQPSPGAAFPRHDPQSFGGRRPRKRLEQFQRYTVRIFQIAGPPTLVHALADVHGRADKFHTAPGEATVLRIDVSDAEGKVSHAHVHCRQARPVAERGHILDEFQREVRVPRIKLELRARGVGADEGLDGEELCSLALL